MRKAHYFSGLFITVFIVFHLINHAFAIISLEKHLSVMETFRIVYRNVFAESILILAVVLQVFSGIKLVLQSRRNAVSFLDKLHIYSGLYLAFFLLVHVSAVFAARIIFKMDSNTYFGAAALNHFPEVFFFVPYYFLAVLAFFTHVACIHFKRTASTLQTYAVIVFGFFSATFLLYALTNHFNGYEIPEAYEKMLEAMSF